MELALLKVLINTSLCVLAWMVQLIIYPGFIFYSEIDIKKWHGIYKQRMLYIVAPLMLAQLMLYTFFLFENPNVLSLVLLVVVLSTWVITFFVAVPLHQAVEREVDSRDARKNLVRMHWIRTLLWTMIFIQSLNSYIS